MVSGSMGRCGSCWGVETALDHDGGIVEQFGGVVALEDGLLHVPVGYALVDLDRVGHDRFGKVR